MANHKDRMLQKIEQLGLIVIHTEIAPYGPGTRRYMVGKHIEEPKRFYIQKFVFYWPLAYQHPSSVF